MWLDNSDRMLHYYWRAALQRQQYVLKLFVYGLWPQALPQAKTVKFEHQPTCICQLYMNVQNVFKTSVIQCYL